jgi:hypothetical protein
MRSPVQLLAASLTLILAGLLFFVTVESTTAVRQRPNHIVAVPINRSTYQPDPYACIGCHNTISWSNVGHLSVGSDGLFSVATSVSGPHNIGHIPIGGALAVQLQCTDIACPEITAERQYSPGNPGNYEWSWILKPSGPGHAMIYFTIVSYKKDTNTVDGHLGPESQRINITAGPVYYIYHTVKALWGMAIASGAVGIVIGWALPKRRKKSPAPDGSGSAPIKKAAPAPCK